MVISLLGHPWCVTPEGVYNLCPFSNKFKAAVAASRFTNILLPLCLLLHYP